MKSRVDITICERHITESTQLQVHNSTTISNSDPTVPTYTNLTNFLHVRNATIQTGTERQVPTYTNPTNYFQVQNIHENSLF